jgi:hypothetical protein
MGKDKVQRDLTFSGSINVLEMHYHTVLTSVLI